MEGADNPGGVEPAVEGKAGEGEEGNDQNGQGPMEGFLGNSNFKGIVFFVSS